jgi:hypothetical protein
MKIFENKVLWRTYVPKKEEVTGAWIKMHNELHNLFSSPNIRVMKEMLWTGHVASVGDEKCIQN